MPLKMAFINLENVQFYHEPPIRKPRNALPHQDNFRVTLVTKSCNKPAPLRSTADPTLKRNDHPKGSIGITQRQGHDLALQHEDNTVGATGCSHNPTSPYSVGDNDYSGLNSHREMTNSCLFSERSQIDNTVDNGDTQDSSAILRESEEDITKPGYNYNTRGANHDLNRYTALPTPVSSTGRGKSTDVSGLLSDVKDSCYVYEEPPKGLERQSHVGSSSIPVPGYQNSPCHLPRPPQAETNQHSSTTPLTPAKLTTGHVPTLLDVADGGASDDYIPECATKSHLGFEALASSSLATTSVLSEPHGSAETPQPQTDQEMDDSGGRRVKRKEKRTYQAEAREYITGIQLPEPSDHTSSASAEGDEVLPPSKRRKRLLPPTENLTLSRDQNPMSYISRRDSLATTISETDDIESEAGQEHPPSVYDLYWQIDSIQGKEVVDGEIHYWVAWQPTLEPKSALKCAKEQIDEFEERCQTQLKAKNKEDAPWRPLTRYMAPNAQVFSPASRPRTRVRWKPEDDTRLVDMRKSGFSWKQIYAAFPDRTRGTLQVRCSTALKSRLALMRQSRHGQ